MNPTQQVDKPIPTMLAQHGFGVGLFSTQFFSKRFFSTTALKMGAMVFTHQIVMLITLLFTANAHSASCCGGGASSGIILPKFNEAMWDVSVSNETYNGYWNQAGGYQADPKGSDLLQRRLNLGYAFRLADQWQMNLALPLVDNQNQYSGDKSSVQALGDMSVGLWYEAFERVTCIYKITSWQSLKPSIYVGGSLTLPTGISPYSDKVGSSFDITGLGFYRLDANVLIEKTIYPYSLSWQGKYGYTFERPINQEYGQAVTPYNKQLGIRTANIVSASYTWFMPNLSMLSLTASHSQLSEQAAHYNGITDHSSGLHKTTLGLALAYSNLIKNWVVKLGISQAQQGENIPKTQILTMGISHVL